MAGPTLPVSVSTFQMKYLEEGEDYEAGVTRVANALKDDEPHKRQVLEITMDQRYLFAGRVQNAMGAKKSVTPYNCFVSGVIEDSLTDGEGSIFGRLHEAAQTLRLGGGIGYDFSTLRPRGDIIKKLGSNSSGPISFMEPYDAMCHTIASAGHRRGAQMAALRVDHPDIFDFIDCKRPQGEIARLWDFVESQRGKIPDAEYVALVASLQKTLRLTGFNISVGITDDFMECLAAGRSFRLSFGGRIYREVDPAELWDRIMRNTWDWAEPGVLFLDRMNRMNNLWYCEQLTTTNPCGEQPLPPYGACLLGSFNLVKYVRRDANGRYWFDFEQLRRDIPPIVRAMDNIVDRAEYPLPHQGREARSKRRMGIGVTGLANALEAMGLAYGTQQFVAVQSTILSTIAHEAYFASVKLAREKGAFPMLDKARFIESGFMQSLDEDVRADICRYGIRNSHLTSIAPTGTISLCADNVSSGIEPVFSYAGVRNIKTFEGVKQEVYEDYGVRVFGVRGKTVNHVTADEHVKVLVAAAKNVDSAVSKTCNIGDHVTFDEFKDVYIHAYEGGAKGCTTFRAAGKRLGIFNPTPEKDEPAQETVQEGGACFYDPATGTRSCE